MVAEGETVRGRLEAWVGCKVVVGKRAGCSMWWCCAGGEAVEGGGGGGDGIPGTRSRAEWRGSQCQHRATDVQSDKRPANLAECWPYPDCGRPVHPDGTALQCLSGGSCLGARVWVKVRLERAGGGGCGVWRWQLRVRATPFLPS